MQQVKNSGALEGPKGLTVTNTYQGMAKGSGGPTKGPMNTSMGKAPGVPRISKHPIKSCTSRKGQQGKGGC